MPAGALPARAAVSTAYRLRQMGRASEEKDARLFGGLGVEPQKLRLGAQGRRLSAILGLRRQDGPMGFLREVPLDEQSSPVADFRKNYGFVPNLLRAQAILPRLIAAQTKLDGAILKEGIVFSRIQKQTMHLVIAAALEDRYWVSARIASLQFLGVPRPRIEQILRDFREAGLPPAEVALLEFCLKLCLEWQTIGLADIKKLRSQAFDDLAILEVVLTCALSRFFCVLSAGLRPEPEVSLEGYLPKKAPGEQVRRAPMRRSFDHGAHGHGRKEPYIRTVYLSPTDFVPFAGVLKTHGFIPNVYRAQSLRPDVLEAAMLNVREILITSDRLARIQKECIFVASSAAILNSYCVAAHCNLLRGFGLSPEEGDQIAIDHHQANISDADKALLDFSIKLALQPNAIETADIDALRALGFSDEQILECEAITALSNYINMLQIGLGAEPDFDVPSGYTEKIVHPLEGPTRQLREGVGVPTTSAATVDDPDSGLVARAQAGELDAFEELIRRHTSSVYRTLMAILGNPEESQDAMQDALLSAFRHIKGFQGRSKFSTWLVSIARNTALQRLRDRKDTESLDDGMEREGEEFRPRQVRAWQDDPEALHSKAESRKLVEKSILGLPSKYRIVVMLRDIEQLSTEEVARQLGLTVPALKARLLRGRLMLRESLAPYFVAPAGKAAL
jgi:RNA polymerase sigma-70 factor, ECF subfamily